MIHGLYLAWRYLSFRIGRSVTLISCVTLIALLPLALELLLAESERQLVLRATATPLLLGSRGSALDLVMNSLYFNDERPQPLDYSAAEEIDASQLGYAIPLYVRYRARNFPVIGTSLDYPDFRGLELASGRWFGLLGECVVGAEVAALLDLEVGDSLTSAPETLFDLAGDYPLKMPVVGILAPNHSADDRAILVDVRTTWVMEGLAHGHEDLSRPSDPTVILRRDGDQVIANAKLYQYTEITPENAQAFHFHGDPAGFPLTAVIAVPADGKSATLLRGRYLDHETHQLIRPRDVVDALLDSIFRIKTLLDAAIGTVALATMLALVLVFALSVRLRQREFETLFKLGASRWTQSRLIGAEILILLALTALLCLGSLLLLDAFADDLVRVLFL